MKRRTLILAISGMILSGIESAFAASKKPSPKPKVSKKPIAKKPLPPTLSPKPTVMSSPSEVPVMIEGSTVKLSELMAPMSAYATTDKSGREYKLMIARPNERTIKIFSARCPHQGNILNQEMKHEFTCDLHGARFDWLSGKVLDGPTINNLEQYEVVIKDDFVYVKL
jgi:Rieske Fe-S protein